VAGSGDQAGSESVAVSGPESTAANRLATEATATRSGGVNTASTKAAASVETTAAEGTVEAASAAMETASPAAARRHNVRCKHSKCCSRQQRDRDFTEHD
jgi:hypothetical protein